MTRKDYVLIAAALKAGKPEPHWDPNKKAQWDVTLNRLIERLRQDNPRFKEETFRSACGEENA